MGTPISDSFDVKIRVVFPRITKSLPDKDSEQISAIGAFTFSPPPTVDTTTSAAATSSLSQQVAEDDDVEKLKNDFNDLLADIERIEKVFAKRTGHIKLEYDPERVENDALATAEENIFGGASGVITYDMYKKVIDFQQKINKFISHQSIENEGMLSGVA